VERERVLGIDACKPGWIGVTLDDGGTSAYFATQVLDEGVTSGEYPKSGHGLDPAHRA
jgi:hypothetical protein